jgi:phage terminase Nu1 subunit (DNA packaging protein)
VADLPMVGVAVVAKVFEVTERRVQQLAAGGQIPRASKGRYDLIKSCQGYIRHLRSGGDVEESDEHAQRTRLLRAQSEKLEMENSHKRGELAPIEVYETAIDGLASRFISALDALAPNVRRQLPHLSEADHINIEKIIANDRARLATRLAGDSARHGGSQLEGAEAYTGSAEDVAG